MAGSIFKELRGLSDKNRASAQLFLNKIGLRVDFDKDGGLFRKLTRPNRYAWFSAVGSRSNGVDQRAS